MPVTDVRGHQIVETKLWVIVFIGAGNGLTVRSENVVRDNQSTKGLVLLAK